MLYNLCLNIGWIVWELLSQKITLWRNFYLRSVYLCIIVCLLFYRDKLEKKIIKIYILLIYLLPPNLSFWFSFFGKDSFFFFFGCWLSIYNYHRNGCWLFCSVDKYLFFIYESAAEYKLETNLKGDSLLDL